MSVGLSTKTLRPAIAGNDEVVFADGPTPNIAEVENNDSRGSAQAINRNSLAVAPNANLPDASLPSARIVGNISSSSDTDYFSIELKAGELLILDVDNSSGNLDTMLKVYGTGITSALAENDDPGSLDPGSEPHAYGHNTDSVIRFRAPSDGLYYFAIQSFQDPENPTLGAYELNVSIGPVATPAQIQEENIQSLLSSRSWSGSNVTYGFPTLATQYGSGEATDEIEGGFSPLNSTQMNAVHRILASAASLTTIGFTELTANPGSAQMRYALSGEPDTAHAIYPGTGEGGDSWYNTDGYNNPIVGNYAYVSFLHESGHALGLKHGHESPALTYDRDSMEFSVMTYRGYIGANTGEDGGYQNETFGYAQTFMMYDIAALQRMYGADFTTNAGNSVYSWDQSTGAFRINGATQHTPGGNRVFMTVWDGGGIDTYDLSNYGGGVTINLQPGEWTKTSQVQLAHLGSGNFARGNVANAFLYQGDARSLIENAIGGAGNDTITGNQASNQLDLRLGGIDTVYGMEGDDGFLFGASFTAADKVDGGAGGNDQVALQGDYSAGLTLGAESLVNIETLLVLPGFDYRITAIDANVPAGARLQIFGTTLGIGDDLTFEGSAEKDGYFVVYGGAGKDTLTGGDGNDGFYFGPGNFAGTDVIHGGPGSNDQIGLDGHYTMTLGGNFDGVETLILYRGPDGDLNRFDLSTSDAAVAPGQRFTVFATTLGTGLAFNGSAESDGSFRFLGSAQGDTLTGGQQGDLLFGSRGADTLRGGGGNDLFVYNSTAESAPGASDAILDFGSGDRIDLSGIDANGAAAGDGAFTFIGAAAFSGAAGELRAFQAGGGWTIEGDIDGDKIADLLIGVTTEPGYLIGAGDFVF